MDLVTCLEVLYYLDRNECPRALASIKKSLRLGGYSVFSSLISKPPYFSLNELKNLVSTEFSLVKAETIHVKLISIFEKIIVKLEKIGRRKGFFKDNNYARDIFKIVPFHGVDLAEKCCAHIGDLSASHAIVIGRRI
jgi:hypothetical protein